MKTIDRKQKLEREQLCLKLADAAAKVEEAIDEFNVQLERLQSPVDDAIEAYNDLLDQAKGFAEDVCSEMEDVLSVKSERWQESDNGQAYQDAKWEWESADFEPIEVNYPDALELPDLKHSELLDSLPEEAV